MLNPTHGDNRSELGAQLQNTECKLMGQRTEPAVSLRGCLIISAQSYQRLEKRLSRLSKQKINLFLKSQKNPDLLLVKVLPLRSVAVSLQVLGEGGAAVSDGQIWQESTESVGVGVLVKQRAHDGHKLGVSLCMSTVGAVHYPSWPQGGAQLPQQEAHLLPAQTQDGLEKAVELHIGHHTHLKRGNRQISFYAFVELIKRYDE